jgi:hypothetical protein
MPKQIKATELIAELQLCVDNYGDDVEVIAFDYMWGKRQPVWVEAIDNIKKENDQPAVVILSTTAGRMYTTTLEEAKQFIADVQRTHVHLNASPLSAKTITNVVEGNVTGVNAVIQLGDVRGDINM